MVVSHDERSVKGNTSLLSLIAKVVSHERYLMYDRYNRETHGRFLVGGHAEERHEDSSVDPGHDLATPQCDWGRGLVWAWPVAEVGVQHLVQCSVIDHLATGREGGGGREVGSVD